MFRKNWRYFCLTVAAAVLALAVFGARGWIAAALFRDDAALTLQGVGPLYVGGRRECSVVLISDHEVITAAHCIFNPIPPHRLAPKIYYVLLGPRGAGYAALRGVKAVAILPGFVHGPVERLTLDNYAVDEALLELDTPVGNDLAKPLPVADWGGAAQVTITGFPRDRPAVLQQQDCAVQQHQGDVTQIGCAVVTGMSGAAVTVTGAKGPELVATVSASVGGGSDPKAALVVSTAALLAQLRAALK